MVNGKVPSRLGGHQTVFELKQRVAVALTKIADRDTYQLGVEELDKIIKSLTSDLVAPLLSCILDTDSEKKSAVRKECIRLMGTLVKSHGTIIGSYLGKIIPSIVKRLKDTDSGVRDACVDTVEVLAAKLSSDRIDTDGLFVALVRPLFEALGEQNKQVQCGSALCLSRVIDTIHDPPPVVLQKMLERTVKLLKNPHFMGKPAVIELNRSIILAGGASTHGSLSSAMKSILESIKNIDWTVRKAACNALADIASCGAVCLNSYRSSCLRYLESCRFDKVKPVRDIALQALQLWRNLPGSNSPEHSDAGSSVKGRDYGDVATSLESKLKDSAHVKSRFEIPKKKVPLSSRKSGSCHGNSLNPGANNWSIEIAVPKNRPAFVAENQNDDSECSSVTKTCSNYDSRRLSDIGYKYVEVDEVQDCSSVFNSFPKNFKSQVISPQCDALEDSSLVISTGTNQRFAVDELSLDGRKNVAKIRDRRRSLDSTITESMSHTANGCSPPTENDMQAIRKQLLEIENKQSNLMDMLKAFTFSVMDSMSMVQSKVSNLETVVHKMEEELVHGGRGSADSLVDKMLEKSPLGSRLSNCTPRPSVDTINQQVLHPVKLAGCARWEENTSTRSRSYNSMKQNSDQCEGVTLKPNRSILPKGNSSFCSQIHVKMREEGRIVSVPINKARVNHRNAMKSYSSLGDLEAAYIDALCSRDENILFELVETTGPVLEQLSEKTASDLLIILGSYLMDKRFVNSIIPWLQQLMDLSSIRGPTYQVLSANAKRELLHSIKEVSILATSNPAERKCFTDIEEALHRLWG